MLNIKGEYRHSQNKENFIIAKVNADILRNYMILIL
jgi:hypothetical protein